MKKSAKLLIVALVVAVLIAVMVVMLRRRGKKVYIVEPYHLNAGHTLYLVDKELNQKYYFQGSLDYVIVSGKEDPVEYTYNGYTYRLIPVIAVGERFPDGKTKRQRLDGTFYIDARAIGY